MDREKIVFKNPHNSICGRGWKSCTQFNCFHFISIIVLVVVGGGGEVRVVCFSGAKKRTRKKEEVRTDEAKWTISSS